MMRVLHADDQQIMRKVIREFLSTNGFSVVSVTDGDIALDELAKGSKFDAIILDNNMGKMGGMKVLRVLRGDKRFDDLPIIVCALGMHQIEIDEVRRLRALFVDKMNIGKDLIAVLKNATKI